MNTPSSFLLACNCNSILWEWEQRILQQAAALEMAVVSDVGRGYKCDRCCCPDWRHARCKWKIIAYAQHTIMMILASASACLSKAAAFCEQNINHHDTCSSLTISNTSATSNRWMEGHSDLGEWRNRFWSWPLNCNSRCLFGRQCAYPWWLCALFVFKPMAQQWRCECGWQGRTCYSRKRCGHFGV
jgi:hypothetical protein